MDGLTFVNKVFETFAWPTVVIVIFLLLRKPMANAIVAWETVKLKYKDWEAEIKWRIGQVVEKAEDAFIDVEAVSTTTTTPDPSRLGDETILNRYRKLIELSPRSAILEAWIEIEKELHRTMESSDSCDSSSGSQAYPANRVISRLVSGGDLDSTMGAVINELRGVRNRVLHRGEVSISADDALDYVMVAMRVLVRLRRIEDSDL